MKKFILFTLFLLSVSFHFTYGQTMDETGRTGYSKLANYTSLLSSNSSFKTTNTTKRIIASSTYEYSAFSDSFLVLDLGVPSYSRVLFFLGQDLLFDGLPTLSPLFRYGLVDYSYTDFDLAVHYKDNLTTPDTLTRTHDADGVLIGASKVSLSPNTTGYDILDLQVTYDSIGRCTGFMQANSFANGAANNIDREYIYSPNDDYLISKITFTSSTFTATYIDSIVINSGKVTDIYYFDQGTILDEYHYTYDANTGLVTGYEYYINSMLRAKNIELRRPDVDFPLSSTTISYYPYDTTEFHQDVVFDVADVVPISYTATYTDSNGIANWQCMIATDADHDITNLSWTDENAQPWKESYLYYAPIPTSVENIADFDAEVSAFPSPTSGLVTIESSEPLDGYTIYDMSGRILRSARVAPSTEIRVNLDDYPAGAYILRLQSNDRSKSIELQKL